MIKAVIFDCFGVLATDGWLPFKAKHFSHNPELLQAVTDLNKQADAGLITYDDFIGGVAKLAHMSLPEAKTVIEDNAPNEPLFAYIKQLKTNYKIGMLSNAADNWLTEIFEPQQVALFDGIALSYETGFIKPSPEAYTIIAERLGVESSTCVFVDDQERYCTGARDVGMQAVLYQDFEQAKRELEKLLADTKG